MGDLNAAKDHNEDNTDEEIEEEEDVSKSEKKLMPLGTFIGSEKCCLGTPRLFATQKKELETFFQSVQQREKFGLVVLESFLDIEYKDPHPDSLCTEKAGVQISCTIDSKGIINEKMAKPEYLTVTLLGEKEETWSRCREPFVVDIDGLLYI